MKWKSQTDKALEHCARKNRFFYATGDIIFELAIPEFGNGRLTELNVLKTALHIRSNTPKIIKEYALKSNLISLKVNIKLV